MQIIIAVLVLLGVLVLLTLAIVVAGYRFGWKWTGVVKDENFSYRTFWDWLSILIVPVLLTLGGILFTAYQGIRQQDFEDQRTKTQQEIEDRRAQDAALQAYLDQMSQLMLEHDLNNAAADGKAQTLAGAQTLTVLQSLDRQKHKKSVLRFLYEANLIDTPHPIVSLEGANLQDIDLENNNLSGGAFLLGPYSRLCDPVLSGSPGSPFGGDQADLGGTNLAGANLRGALLTGLDLRGANMNAADLRQVTMAPDFSNAEPSAFIGKVRLTQSCETYEVPLFEESNDFPYLPEGAVVTDLEGADLSHTKMQGADVSGADMRGSNLTDANLRDAKLRAVDLGDADLEGADLEGADLTQANLMNAEVTDEQLKEARSLEGAVMRDGTIKPITFGSTTARGMPHGLYATEEFKPAMSFSVSDGTWQLSWRETIDGLFITESQGGQLVFTNPSRVWDPSNPSEPKEVPAPENVEGWASWFQGHPDLDTSEPVQVRVGGASGVRLDVTDTFVPDNYSRDHCDGLPRCVPLFPYGGGNGIASFVDVNDRFVIVDVEGETVVINVAAPVDEFDEFIPQAQKVLDTVEWVGSK